MDKKYEGFKIAHITSMIFMYYKMVKNINRKKLGLKIAHITPMIFTVGHLCLLWKPKQS